jgi:hypothetical protein
MIEREAFEGEEEPFVGVRCGEVVVVLVELFAMSHVGDWIEGVDCAGRLDGLIHACDVL